MTATNKNEKLIQVAIQFLSNPKIEPASEESKTTFLKKKGLNDEDIKQAFKLYKEKKEKAAAKEAEPKTTPTTTTDTSSKDEQQDLTLDEKIEKAKKSNVLSLKKSNLTTIPPAVFNLTNLTTLIISFNKLQNIPDEIKNLTNLQVLHASNCFLSNDQISQQLWLLPNLKELNLVKNTLIDMKPILNVKSLTKLDLSDNDILEIPSDIDKLQNLETLNLRNNNISSIPKSISNIKPLKTFLISGNNIDSKLEEVLKQSGFEGLKKFQATEY